MLNVVRVITSALLLLIPTLSQADEKPAHYFFISHAGVSDPFWKVPFKGARDAAKEMGVKLTILAPERPNDYGRQITLLRQAIAQQPDGIATTISDRNGFSTSLIEAKQKRIPVIAFNARPTDDNRQRNPYLAYIGMDDYAAGQSLAKQALQRGELSKRVVVVIQQAGHAGLEARFGGIAEILSHHGLSVDRLDSAPTKAETEQKFRTYIQNHSHLSAVITLGPDAAHPIGRVIKKDGLQLYFASFDLSPLSARMIKDGLMDFTIDQQPYMQGYLSIKLLHLANRYAMTPPDINTGIGLIDRHNLPSVEKLAKTHIR
ncbi:sugar ABC transporter substrate-binding protein [Magnetococcus sp. PR-3]|uniref:sugar ABC transporter substrate-binding protein n=1 Tax=Magnetococcus sp. PR-3 TaxID=3120355 RepID=UPI002FCE3214